MKKICFITTSRADFGTLNELILETIKERNFLTQLIISGNHYANIFGKTAKEINYEKSTFNYNRKYFVIFNVWTGFNISNNANFPSKSF